MLDSVKVNDHIVTIMNTWAVLKIKDDILTIRIADKTEIEIENCRGPYFRKRRVRVFEEVLVKGLFIWAISPIIAIKDRNRKRN